MTGAQHRGSMSGHLRFCFTAFVLLACLSTSPASSNPLADLLSVAPQTAAAPASAETAAPASAERECLAPPGKSTPGGQHWVYRSDGHRKCWFQAAREIATVKKRVDHQAAKHRDALPAEDDDRAREREAVVDARAELPSSAPPESVPPTPPVSKLELVDAASVVPTGVGAIAPPALVANRGTDQVTPDHLTRLTQVDVETHLEAAPAASDPVAAYVPPDPPFPIAEAGDDLDGWLGASWLYRRTSRIVETPPCPDCHLH